MTDTQSSRLLSALFENLDPESTLTVLNIGPALPETVDFFSQFRCKLHIADLLAELPLAETTEDGEDEPNLGEQLQAALLLPENVLFDIVFFWDVINFMNQKAVSALMELIRPHLHARSRGHCFAVHSAQTPAAMEYYGVADHEHLSVRPRSQLPPGYQPHLQGDLTTLMKYFATDGSVLMRDRRVEILLKARL